MSLNNWLGDTGANRYKQTYFNGFVDINNGDLIVRTGNLYLGATGNGALILNNTTSISKNELALLKGATGQTLQSQINNLGLTGSSNSISINNLQNQINNVGITGAANTISINNLQNQINNVGITGAANTISINNLQSQINNVGLTGSANSTSINNLQTKTQNINATSSLTTFSNGITLTTGDLTLTSGNLTIASTKSLFCNGALNFGTLGRITVGGVSISNSELGYLTGLTSSVESRIGNNTTNITTNTNNIASNTSAIATNTSNIASNTSAIATNTTNISTNTSSLTGITYDSNSDFTNIDNNLNVSGYISSTGGLLAGSTIALTSTASTSNIILTSTGTAGTYSTRQNAGDACILSSNPLIWVCSPSGAQTDALKLTSTQFQIFTNILASGNVITPTSLGFISGLSSNIENSIIALNNKTANITNATGGTSTTFTNTTSFNGPVNIATTRTLNINGTGKIALNGTTSYIDMGTSLGFLTNTVYISPLEMSYLDGASSNIQTSINNINTSLTDLNIKTTAISYTVATATTTISDIVNFTGTTKTTGTTWADGPIKLKTSWVAAPASGELGYSVSSSLTTVSSITSNVVKNLLQISLGVGVWIITYNCFIIYGSPIVTTFLKLGLNPISGSTQGTVGINTEANGSYIANKNYSMTQIINVSTSTTYYLTLYALFSGGSLSVDGGNVNTSELKAVRIA